jgi:putative nucleotidyltransferase with HDIG domain
MKKQLVRMDNTEYAALLKKLRFLDGSNKALLALQEKVASLAAFRSETILSHNISQVFQAGFTKLNELIDVKSCSLFFVDDKGLEFVHHASIPEERAAFSREEAEAQINSGTFGWTVGNGSPTCVPALISARKNDSSTRVMMEPLNTKDRTIGVLFIIFDEDEACVRQGVLKLLYILADLFALSLVNAHLFQNLNSSYLATIEALVNAVEAKDRYTKGHSVRVAQLANAVGQALNLSGAALNLLQMSALLHDVGKIGVPESILLKPSKLTDAEYEQIKQHPAIGAAILRPIKDLEEVAEIVYRHHERYDGKGYMDGLKENEIPLAARILAVCDTYAAMTSDRPHRAAVPEDRAIAELQRVAGKQLDPVIVEVLLKELRKKTNSVKQPRVGVY